MKGEKNRVKVMGRFVDVPVIYEDLSASMIFLPAYLHKVKKVLNNNRLNPIIISKDRCLLGVTIFNYKKCPVGEYNELAISIPVLLDQKFFIPWIPFVFSNWFKKFGYYTILLSMDTDIARKHSEIIFGYPTYSNNIKIKVDDHEDKFIDTRDGENPILSIWLKRPKHFKRTKKQINTYIGGKGGGLLKVKMNVNALVGHIIKRKNMKLNLGNKHQISDIIGELISSQSPVVGACYDDALEILSGPQKI